jgi:hypothetical protein
LNRKNCEGVGGVGGVGYFECCKVKKRGIPFFFFFKKKVKKNPYTKKREPSPYTTYTTYTLLGG